MDIEKEKKEKKDFLYTEIAKAAINAATQRNKFYRSKISKDRRDKITEYWTKKLLIPKVDKYKDNQILDVFIDDILNIKDELIKIFPQDITCRLSHAQKSFSLFLKYYWCMGYIKEPPACPLDRPVPWNAGIKDETTGRAKNWTELDDKDTYRVWLKTIKDKAQEKNLTMAQWELDLWNREMERRSHRNQQKASSKPSM